MTSEPQPITHDPAATDEVTYDGVPESQWLAEARSAGSDWCSTVSPCAEPWTMARLVTQVTPTSERVARYESWEEWPSLRTVLEDYRYSAMFVLIWPKFIEAFELGVLDQLAAMVQRHGANLVASDTIKGRVE